MKKCVAFLRGINVGGHKKFLKIAQLQMANFLGFTDPQVYLHTGNWIFNSSVDTWEVSEEIEQAIFNKFGWEVPVLVLHASEIDNILNNCPFPEENKLKSYFVLLKDAPLQENISEIEKLSTPQETFLVIGKCIYIYYKKGAGSARFTTNWFEKKLNVVATARNFKTMANIHALLKN